MGGGAIVQGATVLDPVKPPEYAEGSHFYMLFKTIV